MIRFVPLLAGVVAALGFPPFGPWPLVFVGVGLLLWRLRETERGWRTGYAFGVGFGAVQLSWIAALVSRWTGSPLLGGLPYLVAVGLYAVYFGLFGWLARRAIAAGRVWTVPLLWAGVEVFRSYLPVLAFPWGLLGGPTAGFGLGWGRFGTIYLASAAVVAITGAVVFRRRSAYVQAGASVLIGVVGWFWVLGASIADTREIRVAAGQPAVDYAFGDPARVQVRSDAAVSRLVATARADGDDLLILPEGIARAGAAVPPRVGFPTPGKPTVVFGAQRGAGPVYQSAFAYDGRAWRWVDKTRLVIFGEFVPGRDLLPFLSAFRLPAGDLSAGTLPPRALPTAVARVAPVICFEALFPDLSARMAADGAEIVAVMSIDDWFFGTNAPAQLAQAAYWRAAETGRPLARAATQGRTFVIRPDGTEVAAVPLGREGSARARVWLAPPGRPVAHLAFFPALALLTLVIEGAAAAWSLRRRGGRATPGSDPTPAPGDRP